MGFKQIKNPLDNPIDADTPRAKKCVNCGKVKALCFFKPTRKSKDGYSNTCLSCKPSKKQSNASYDKESWEETIVHRNLQQYTNDELMIELKHRGYSGKLSFVRSIDLDSL